MKFLGIDLGWRSQPSGLCCLNWGLKRNLVLGRITGYIVIPNRC
ncbi:hypothetical protein [Funiculus sociatus]